MELDQDALDQVHGGADAEPQDAFVKGGIKDGCVLGAGGIADIKMQDEIKLGDPDKWSLLVNC